MVAVGLRATSIVAALVLLAACDEGKKEQAAAPPPPPPAVTVMPAGTWDLRDRQSFTGRVEAADVVELRARVSGFLEQRNFQEGQDVKQGDLLFVIEKAPYKADISEIQGSIARANASLEVARLERERQQALVKKQAVAQAKLDEASAREGEARGDLLRLQASLERAQLDLSYTDIVAPISGRIGRATYTVGNYVTPQSQPLATIVSFDPIYVTFPVTQRQLIEVRRIEAEGGTSAGESNVRLRLADGTYYDAVGRFNFIDVRGNTQTDTVTVRATFPNPDNVLIDGALVTAVVESKDAKPTLVIPESAMLIDQAGRYVLTVGADNKVEQVRIEVGAPINGMIAVTSGLKEGDKVIVEGIQKVRPGVPVTVSEQPLPVQPPVGN